MHSSAPSANPLHPIPANNQPITRLAPSPTGALHLGNARTFLLNWALARRNGWRIVLRIEDLDGPRVKPEAAQGIIDTLRWLGIEWDEGPFIQSADLEPYRQAIARMAQTGLAYPSDLSRAQIEAAASAPQQGSHEVVFPALLRPALQPRAFDNQFTNWRFATPAGVISFVDAFAGPQSIDAESTIGDFVLWTKRGTPAYQLAVVVDDHRQHIGHVVRGDDLLNSAARQILLYRALGLAPEPEYTHLPLVIGPDGKRLAKRHGDTRVDTYRTRGVPAEAVIGLIAHWCGLTGHRPAPRSAREFLADLDLTLLPRAPVTFTPEHDQWLLSSTRP